MFEGLGISFGTALIVLLALYFIVKWAVKNGIKEAYRDITGKVTTEDIEAEQICNELDLNEQEKSGFGKVNHHVFQGKEEQRLS